MATNALVQPYVQGVQQQVICPLQDPVIERANRRQFGREVIEKLELANAFYTPAGRWPSRGYVLILREDLNLITNKFINNLQLNFTDTLTGTSLTFQGLSIVQSWCVSRGIAGDVDAVYLVELTDNLGILLSPWFAFPTVSQYNVIAPAYPGQYYSASTNGGVPWDWNGMVGDLWNQMGTFLGAYPGLPAFPMATPQNFSFPGVSAWDALDKIMVLLGQQIASDNTKASPYTIVVVGATDNAFTALQTKYAGVLESDFEYQDLGAGRMPGTVNVLFHRRQEYYGTEETVRDDGFQWWTTPLVTVPVTATAAGFPQFAAAPGVDFLWDDFVIRFDVDGNTLAADVANAVAIAMQRAGQYYQRAYRGTQGFLQQTYTGVLPFVTGSQVDGIAWKQDTRGQGFKTIVVRGPQPPFPEARKEYDPGYF